MLLDVCVAAEQIALVVLMHVCTSFLREQTLSAFINLVDAICAFIGLQKNNVSFQLVQLIHCDFTRISLVQESFCKYQETHSKLPTSFSFHVRQNW